MSGDGIRGMPNTIKGERQPRYIKRCKGCVHNIVKARRYWTGIMPINPLCRRCKRWLKENGMFWFADMYGVSDDSKSQPEHTVAGEKHPRFIDKCRGCVNYESIGVGQAWDGRMRINAICRRCARWLKSNGKMWFSDMYRKAGG